MTKICIKCGCEKEIDMFYKHSKMKDGHLNKCIECCKTDARINGKSESAKRYNRNRPNKKERNEANKKRMEEMKKNNPEKYYEMKNKAQRNYRAKHPEKYQAHEFVSAEKRKGKIEIPELCFFCGSKSKLEAHHPDYTKPDYVIWLCSKCHHNIHKNSRTLERKTI